NSIMPGGCQFTYTTRLLYCCALAPRLHGNETLVMQVCYGIGMSSTHVSLWVELAIKPGRLDEFEKLTGEMVAATRAERGVVAYQRFISGDRRTAYVHERYEDSEAAVAHLRKFAATFGKRYSSMVERKRFVVFGQPSDALRTLLDEYDATYHLPFGPFAYWGWVCGGTGARKLRVGTPTAVIRMHQVRCAGSHSG